MSLYDINQENGVVKTTTKFVGKGVYAKRDFRMHDIVLYFHGPIIPSDKVDDFDLGLQVGDDLFMMSAGDIDDYVNHSCEPNTVLLYKDTPYGSQWCLVAIRSIEQDEEITFDYSVTMSGRYWTMCCKCGSKGCRKVVTDFDLLDFEKQLELLRYQKIFSKHNK